jgi:hypothetical protein
MKTLVSILVLGITFLSYSQENHSQASVLELDDVIVSAHAAYLNKVQDEKTPAAVKRLQQEVVTYNVRMNKDFDKTSNEPYQMLFKSTSGMISAFYDASGQVVASYEKFKDIMLPEAIRDRVFRDNANWEMISNKYVSNYTDNKLTKRTFKVKLQNGNLKKDMIFDVNN